MKITLTALREVIKEDIKAWARQSARGHKQTGSRVKNFGKECDAYVKMLVATTDPESAEEYMGAFYEPDQALEDECSTGFDNNIAAIKKEDPEIKTKTLIIKRELKKAKISDKKPRKVTDKSGVNIVNFKDWVRNIGQKT